ncbi:MAG: rod shape-determining protein [Lachnospiraceae bacterium]|nr:rod shape-determining protein [Lachnospiraceae bacterium]
MGISAFGIDLGTSNIKIYNGNTDNFFIEKNMIAIEGKDNLFAYGDSAFEMYEKAPDNINVSFPLCNGVIADIRNMQTLIKYFINDISKGNVKPCDYYIAVPTDVTEVEKRAFYELIKDSNVKARRVLVVEKAIADGLGMGIDVKTSQGVLVVDVGYETTEISILSLGGIVLSRLIKVGGNKFDESIKNAIRKEYNLIIGSKTAEKVKYAVKEMETQNKNAIVYGRDIVTGLPVEKGISPSLVHQSLQENFNVIVDSIRQILERTPPELGADIYRNGIFLTGGASCVNHLADLIHEQTGLRINTDEEPMATVVKGLSTIIKEEKYQSIAYAIE